MAIPPGRNKMIFVLILAVVLVVFIVLRCVGWDDDLWGALMLIAVILLVAFGLLWMVVYSCSIDSYADIRAYSKILEETPEAVILIQRAITTEDYAMELADLLHTYKAYNNYWFIRQWIAKTPDDIRAMYQ